MSFDLDSLFWVGILFPEHIAMLQEDVKLSKISSNLDDF